MHRKGRLGLLVDDGSSDTEIDFLSSGWLLPPAHDDGPLIARDIKVQHIEWAGDAHVDFTAEQRTIDAQQSATSQWSILWALTLGLWQAFRFGWIPQNKS